MLLAPHLPAASGDRQRKSPEGNRPELVGSVLSPVPLTKGTLSLDFGQRLEGGEIPENRHTQDAG